MISTSLLLILIISNCKLGKTSTSSDSFYNYCNRTSPSGIVPKLPNSMSNYLFKKQPCFCDADCWKYGDCCEDASSLTTYKNADSSLNAFNCEKITNGSHSVYVVKTCPSTWSDDNTRSLCLKEVESENYHYMLDVPVFSKNSRHLYANSYCSICNNDHLNASLLKLKLNCIAPYNCKNESIENNFYVPGQLRWILPNTHEIIATVADPQFSDVRKCQKAVDKCANNWTGNSNLCRDYNYYVRGCSGTVYKNIHCAKCNYDFFNLQTCTRITGRQRSGDIGLNTPFNWILDFKLSPYNKQCSKPSEFYDEFLDACVPLLCGKNYDLIDGQCKLKPECQNKSNSLFSCIYRIVVRKNELHIFSNGTIYRNRTQTMYNESKYEVIDNKTYLVCINNDNINPKNFGIREFSLLENHLSTACLSISLVCLGAHIIIRCVMNKRSKIPGKTLLSLSISLFIGQLLYFFGIHQTENENVCFTIGVLIHFFYLSVFFWKNVMAIDICLTLSRSHRRIWSKKIFYYYSAYAWLCPLLIVIVSVTIDLVNPTSNIRPRYGRDVCWISDRFALFLFFALPIGILVVTNFVLYFVTSYNIHKNVSVNTGLIKSQVQRFRVYVKLAVVLGLTWVVGFVAAFTDFEPLWYGFIILNASQGSFILIVFTLKRQVLRQLCQKLCVKTSSSTSTSRQTDSTLLNRFSSNSGNEHNDELKFMLKNTSQRSI